LLFARATVAWAEGDEALAREHLGGALAAAREAGMKEWVWRVLEFRAEVEDAGGVEEGVTLHADHVVEPGKSKR
jgi:hypothetical protein